MYLLSDLLVAGVLCPIFRLGLSQHRLQSRQASRKDTVSDCSFFKEQDGSMACLLGPV